MTDMFRRRSRKRISGIISDHEVNAASDDQLDLSFYRSRYPDIATMDDASAAKHWERHGRLEKRWPNARLAILSHPHFNRLPQQFDPVDYVFLNRDLIPAKFDAITATMHFLDFGINEGRKYSCADIDYNFMASYQKSHPHLKSTGLDAWLLWQPKTAEQFLYLQGFGDSSFLKEFDHEFYASNHIWDSELSQADGNACIIHFGETGVNAIAAISDNLRFDPEFHRRALRRASAGPATFLESDVFLYKNWLSRYEFITFPPNHKKYIKNKFGVSLPGNRKIIDIGAYRFANQDLRHLDDEAVIEHIFSNGLLENRSFIKLNNDNIDIFISFANYLEKTGRVIDADSIYIRLSHFLPDNIRLNRHRGDFLMRRGKYYDAYRSYEKIIRDSRAGKWTYLNAATCCERFGDFAGALATLEAGCVAYPDDQGLARQRAIWAERFFSDEFATACAIAKAGNIAEGQDRALAAAKRCNFPIDGSAPGRPIKTVALFANMDIMQCTLYRVEQKAEQLVAAGFAVRIYNKNTDQRVFEREISAFDAVIFYRVAAFPEVIRYINSARAAGLATFYDIDDLVFDSDHFPEPLADYAGQITPAEYVDICMTVPLFRYAVSLCDYAIASTSSLARFMEPLVREHRAFVHRNALGIRHEREMSARGPTRSSREDFVTIFYGSGTKAHKFDFETILLPALEEIDRRFGSKIEIVMVGHRPREAESPLYGRIRFVPFMPDIEAYWALLREADISLSVLRETPATGAKSEIKWLEAAMFGIPSVVSATDTFSEVIEDGVDGLLASTTANFVEALSLLVRDKARREAIGKAAKAKAIRDYGMHALSTSILSIIQAVEAPRRDRTRVLIVNVFYPPQAKGGATRVVIDNIKDIRDLYPNKFEFEVFTTLEGAPDPYTVHVSSHDGVRTTAMVAGNYPEVDYTAIDDRAGELFKTCVERFEPHLIHFHCIQRMSAAVTEVALRAGIPYVITAHDGWWISDRQFLYDKNGPAPLYDFNQPLKLRLGAGQTYFDRPLKLMPSLKGAFAVLAVSDRFADIYRATGLGNVRSLPNGLPLLKPNTASAEKGKAAGKTVRIAHIGGTEVHKGVPLLRRAIIAAKPINISVTIVDLALDPGEDTIEEWGGVTVHMIAKRKQSDMQSLYDQIDVLFAPSLWPESFGLVTREALAAGCWVVASDRGAIGEPVTEGLNGHIVSVDTIGGLVEVIARIDADPDRYKQAPPAGPAMRTARDQARDLVDVYREMVM